jgi:microcystin-dependent protein
MEPFLGQIQLFGFGWTPKGWMPCEGQLLSISANTALFSLLGTTYGGDGKSSFALPDLRGRAPFHQGQGHGLSPRALGEIGGEEAVTLTSNQVPPHAHGVQASASATSKSPSGLVPAFTNGASSYGSPDGTAMAPGMITSTAQPQPVDNMPPYLVMNYCIAIVGIYPSRD